MNTAEGGKIGISGSETTTARIFEGTMNVMLYCDILQQELTQAMGKLPKKSAYTFQQDLAPWYTSKFPQENMAKSKLDVLYRMASRKSGSQSS